MTILKLQNEGESYTGLVHTCEAVKGQYGEQVKFDFIGGDTLYLPKESADRQLGRCGFTVGDGSVSYGDVEGNTLTFSRDHNPKPGAKPYWGISVATKADLKPKPASKRVPSPSGSGDLPGDPGSAYAPPAEDYGREPGEELVEAAEQAKQERDAAIRRVVKLGLGLWDQVAAHQVAAGKQDNYPVDAASISRFASTLFIEMNHRNLLK